MHPLSKPMNHPRVIKYISYLNHQTGKRDKSYSDPLSGKFPVNSFAEKGTAYQFCEQEHIKKADPTLNLNDGDKVRVYMGGDPSVYTAYALGAIEKHQSVYKMTHQESEKRSSDLETQNPDPYDSGWIWKTYFSD